jgi:hypothetical protein
MPTADRLASPEPREPLSFRMPLVPADYLDRSPVLTQEERTGVAKLLQLPPPRYLEFDRQVRKPEPSDPTADGCAGSVPAMASKEPGGSTGLPDLSVGSRAPDEHPVLGMVTDHLDSCH